MTARGDAQAWDRRHPRAASFVAALVALACWYRFLSAARSAAHSRAGFPWGLLGFALIAFAAGYAALLLALRYRLGADRPAGPSLAGVGLTALLSAGAVLLAVLTFAVHDDATRSSRVQHQGISASGTIFSVKVNTATEVSDQGERTVVRSVEVVVRLDEPVGSVQVTRLRLLRPAAFREGQRLDVLLDPEDAAYAELPGHASRSSYGWLLLLLGSLTAWAALLWVSYRDARPST